MPQGTTPQKEARDFNDDSDSSDGTNPPTPRKASIAIHGPSLKPPGGGQVSPAASPTKATGPSPKRTLFSRPSRMNIKTDAREIANAGKGDGREYFVSPTSPSGPHPAAALGQPEGTLPHSSTASSFSSLLKHAGHHVPPILQHTAARTYGQPLHGSTPRGKSFDMLRIGGVGGAAAGDAFSSSLGHPPISPSFFSSAGRSASHHQLASDADDLWPLICARVLPLFNGEGLRQPIEDLNRLVASHLRRVLDRHEGMHLLEDVTELFETGIRSLDNNLAALPDEKLTTRLSEIWTFFFSTILPYLEATFLPLTIEWSSNPAAAASNTTTTTTNGASSAATQQQAPPPDHSIHLIACKSYRDILILPLAPRLGTLLAQVPVLLGLSSGDSGGGGADDDDDGPVRPASLPRAGTMGTTSGGGGGNGDPDKVYPRMLQCVSLLRRVRSGDAAQRACDDLGNAVLFRRARGRGDRRGIILGTRAGATTAAAMATGGGSV